MNAQDKIKTYWMNNLSASSGLTTGEELFFGRLLEIALTSKRILEVGVGRGRMVKVLHSKSVTAEFHGIDITEDVYRSGTIGVVGDARKLPYDDETFDLVYSLGVVEHFPETSIAVYEHARVVRKGGYVLVTTPHLCLLTPLRYLAYLFNGSRIGTFEEVRGRNLLLRDMKKTFHHANLSIEYSGFYGLYGINRLSNKLLKFQRNPCIGSYLYIIGRKK